MAPLPFILIVDDDANVANVLTDHLEARGFRVTHCHDAAQAVLQAEALKIGLVILDLVMSGFGTGIDAYKNLRVNPRIARDLPIVFLTGLLPAQAQKVVPLRDPRVRLLHKPVAMQDLLQAVQELTGASAAPERMG